MPVQITSMRDSLLSGFTQFINFIPTLLGAIVVLVLGWYVAKLVGRLVARGLQYAHLDRAVHRSGLQNTLAAVQPSLEMSGLIGTLAKWFVFLIFVQAAANLLGMPQITNIINSILLYIPNVIVAVLILVVGAWLAKLIGGLTEGAVSRTGVARPHVFGMIARYAVIGFAVIAALNQLNIAVALINTLFIGLVGSLALAIGLAFGLGGQGVASEMTRRWYDQARSNGDRLKAVGGAAGGTPPRPPERGPQRRPA